MSRQADLQGLIRDAYGVVHEYETMIQTSDRPEEKARARRLIAEQWSLIEGYLAEYRRLAGEGWPPDIVEIAAYFAAGGDVSSAPAAATVFDQRGQQVGQQINVAGDYYAAGARAGPAASDASATAESAASLRRQLAEAQENLRLIGERKAQYVLEVDVPLQLVKEERRLLARIAELRARLAEEG